MQKNLWKEYLYFSRNERIALLVLLLVIGLLLILPRIITLQTPPPQPDLVAMNQLTNAAPVTAYTNNTVTPAAASRLFGFDPNTLDAAGLLQLGLREKVVRTLVNYRNKGGHFYKAEDLRKIYGLQPEEASRLIPYVTIKAPGKNTPAAEQPVTPTPQQPAITTAPAGLASGKQFAYTNINTATAADWKRFPGIGEVLSKRIVAFRHKLGGFQSVQQVSQTYALPDSVFEKMLPYLYIDTVMVRNNNNMP